MKTTSPYKTAAELGIEQWEHDGLVALIGPLSRGELKLNMLVTDSECGTVCCIGGWLAIRHGIRWQNFGVLNYVDRERSKTLSPLYYPVVDGKENYNASAPQAARAIVNFLTLGDPRWDDVMREAA